MNFSPKISKEKIEKLEKQAFFCGEKIVIDTLEQSEAAIQELSSVSIVGFDTETKPSFTRGELHDVALIQIATEDKAFLFRTNKIDIPDSLINFIENKDILKIGLSLQDDFRAMRRKSKGLQPQGFVDLQKICPAFGILELSLKSIYAIIFEERISKQSRLINWEMENLTQKAIDYAALDAFACLRIYQKLNELQQPPMYRFGLMIPQN